MYCLCISGFAGFCAACLHTCQWPRTSVQPQFYFPTSDMIDTELALFLFFILYLHNYICFGGMYVCTRIQMHIKGTGSG